MATIAENLQTIIDIKADIKTAIENKGVTVGDSSFTDYPTLINNIPQENTGGDITLTNIDITTNGTYTAPDGVGYKTINVDVPSGGDTTTYSYKIPTADVEGLKALGWDNESIGYFRDNNLCYDWQNDNYIVTDGNKELYGVITKDNISSHKSDPNFVYCPMIDTSNMTDMRYMFNDCSSLQSIPLLNTSNVKNMTQMFANCSSLQSIPLLNTSDVTTMESIFYICNSLTAIPMLDTSNVTGMRYMFYKCSSLTAIPMLDTSNATSMESMFNGCSLLQSIPLFNTSNVKNMRSMFAGCTEKLKSIPLLNTSNVTDMDSMFQDCSKLQSIPELNTLNVTSMSSMFKNCNSLQSIPQFDTTKVTNMEYMFYGCTKLQSLPLLDCGNITNMNSFLGHSYNNTLTDLGGFKDLKISLGFNLLNLCPNLTVESLMNVINNVYDLTANGLSGQSLKFGQTNLDKLTAEQIAVATAKGWTLTT